MKQFIQPKRPGEKLDAHRMSKNDKVTAESLKNGNHTMGFTAKNTTYGGRK